MVIAVLIILAVGFATRSIGEQKVADKERDSIHAFWLAEAGLDMAISQLADTPLSGTLGRGKYYTETSATTNPIRFLIVSKGGVPDTVETDPNNIIREIRAIVELPENDKDSSVVTSAITAEGDVDVKGSADVNGEIDANAVFVFEDIFGVSKETMEENSTNLYLDPPNNVTPVSGITWINIETIDEVIIGDSYWEGSGILVVDGDLRITGGAFRGVLWVTGNLFVSGNCVIDGAVYVEGGIDSDTDITGNSTISFDADAVDDAFNFIPSDLPPYILSWKEE
jgi:cytoskeletal protein CcmA (bactofilin family)